MSDYIMELAKNPWARKIASSLHLPVSLPPVLDRRDDPWSDEEFSGHSIMFINVGHSADIFEKSLIANIHDLSGQVLGDSQHASIDEAKINGLVIDLSGLSNPEHLDKAFQTIQKHQKQLEKSGRIVLAMTSDNMSNAMRFALVAFVKSLAREIGRHGKTANLIFFEKEAAQNTSAACTWLLSPRSAFVSGQVIEVSKNSTEQATKSELLSERTAIVTGASRGIGLAICQVFRREGAKVIGIDHPSEDVALASAMKEIGADMFAQDLTDPKAVENIKNLILNGPGQIDIMIHNAGITRDRTLAKMTKTEWDTVMMLNYVFPEKMSQELLRPGSAIIPLIKQSGRIIGISSIVGIAGNFGQTNYAAAKGGIIGLSKDMRENPLNISVNAVACGYIETNMTAKIPPLMREIARRMNALKQSGLPCDVAEACLFLASPLGAGVSGQTFRVCGHHPAGA